MKETHMHASNRVAQCHYLTGFTKTRSSRMPTAHMCFIVNKFEHGRGWDWGPVKGDPCMVKSNASRVMVIQPPFLPPTPVNRMTDTTRNIRLAQLRWRTVKIHLDPKYYTANHIFCQLIRLFKHSGDLKHWNLMSVNVRWPMISVVQNYVISKKLDLLDELICYLA